MQTVSEDPEARRRIIETVRAIPNLDHSVNEQAWALANGLEPQRDPALTVPGRPAMRAGTG